MLVIRDLAKTYASGVQALKGVSLDLNAGVFGLIGPNGSGKTTLMKIMATLLEPDSGTIEMNRLAAYATMSLNCALVRYPPGPPPTCVLPPYVARFGRDGISMRQP